MQIINLIILIIAFSVILGMLIFFYVYQPSKKVQKQQVNRPQKPTASPTQIPTFEKLVERMKKRTATIQELQEAAELILKYYGAIKPKNGIAPSKDFKRYGEVMFIIARHPNTTKELVVMFDKELANKNPDYRREIDEMLNRGLSAR